MYFLNLILMISEDFLFRISGPVGSQNLRNSVPISFSHLFLAPKILKAQGKIKRTKESYSLLICSHRQRTVLSQQLPHTDKPPYNNQVG